ncbi:jmjC domain-containing protein [Aphelenchoides avenae]|nr:jmjC domain-containing protein [Aphelenchus avenae]
MEPQVIRGHLSTKRWHPFVAWTPEYLSKKFVGDLEARFGPKDHKGKVLHDKDTQSFPLYDLSQFFGWANGTESVDDDDVTPATHWGYIDYKDAVAMMGDHEAEKIDWAQLDLLPDDAGVDHADSTVWIGTAGAWTPCHQDSYGFNIVAQIRGRKRWVLFPPDDDLKPTRIPFEETSVFSQLDVIGGDPRLVGTHPRVVELTAGDVLFVPPKWWHSVQCVNPDNTEADRVSVSVNKWFPAEGDKFEQLKESIATFMAHLLNQQSLLGEESLCRTERETISEVPTDILVEMIRQRARDAASKNGQSNGVEPAAKKARIAEAELIDKTYERVCQLGETVAKVSAEELIVKCRAARAELLSTKDEEYNWSSWRAEPSHSAETVNSYDVLTPPPDHQDFGAAFLDALCGDAVLSAIAERLRDRL